jgi:catechol 2,3-dioxygenase-like lactoylglutathione lyase family enzyme
MDNVSPKKVIEGGTPTVYVSDMDRAVAFYTETLGLKLAGRYGDEYASVDAGRGFFVGLHPSGPRSPKPGTPGSIQLSFGVHGKIEDVVAELTQRGIEFPDGIINDDPVKLAFFTDPDGNELYLCEYNPGG